MNSTTHLNTIRRGSRLLAPLCLLAAIVWPLVETAWMLRMPAADLLRAFSMQPIAGGSLSLTLGQRLLLATLGAVPALAASAGLWGLYRCFRLFAAADIFSVRTVRWLRRCAGWTFCSVALSLIAHPLVGVVLTASLPGGEHEAVFSFGSEHFRTLLLAGTVWVISGAMAEAGRLAEENAGFV